MDIDEKRKEHLSKNDLLSSFTEPVSYKDFYRALFPVGSFEEAGVYNSKKPNGMATVIKDEISYTLLITDEHKLLDELITNHANDLVIISPLSYIGKRSTAVNSRFLYALTFDVDFVTTSNLQNLLFQIENDIIPAPTYVVNSGTGIHLYYLFDEPIPLFNPVRKDIKALKYDLLPTIWNQYTSSAPVIQYQGIIQKFRMVGRSSKLGSEYPVRAFLYGTGKKWKLDELIQYSKKKRPIIIERYHASTNIETAKTLWPEWYKKRVVEKKEPGAWTCSPALYNWWLNRITKEAVVGHRYYSIFCLAVYAKKSGVSKEQLCQDAYNLLPRFAAMTNDPNNQFTKLDVDSALKIYNENCSKITINEISRLSGIEIKKNKRNGRDQLTHLKRARSVQFVDYPNGEWRNKKGRPTKKEEIEKFQKEHPNATVTEIARATNSSRPTVYKYYVKT